MGKSSAKQAGFTLVELLVVIAIIGILATVAVMNLGGYKQRAHDMHAISSLRHAVTAQEAYHGENAAYTGNVATLPSFTIGDGITLSIISADNQSWTASAYHSNGEQTFCFDSQNPSRIEAVDGLNSACP